MKKIISYLLNILCVGLTVSGIYTVISYYTSDSDTGQIMTMNIALIVLVGLLQFGLTLTKSKKYINLIIKQDVEYSVSTKTINQISWRQQLNYFSIFCILIGLANIVMYLINSYSIDKTFFFILVFMFVPIFGFFESKKELTKHFKNSRVDLKCNDKKYTLKIGEKTIEFEPNDLRFSKRYADYVLAQNRMNKDRLIIPIDKE